MILLVSGLAAQGQQSPKPVCITHTLSLTAFQPGKTIRETLRFSGTSYRQIRQDRIPIDLLLQVDNVPAAVADKLRLGSSQKPENEFDGDNGTKSLVFKQEWRVGTNPLSLTITNQAAQRGSPPMIINLTEPVAVVTPIAATGPTPVAADENDAFIIDLCSGSTRPVQYPKKRPWAYVRPHEQTRMIVKRINPLRNGISVDVATLIFNADPKVALSNVAGILDPSAKGFTAAGGGGQDAQTFLSSIETTSVSSLTALLAITDELNKKLSQWRKLDCLTDDIIRQITDEVTRVDNLLVPYSNEAWFNLGLKRLATQVEAIAATKKSPLKEQLMDLATYAKRDAVAKETYALLGQLRAVPDGVRLSTPLVEVKDYPNADVIRFTMTKTNRLDSSSRAINKYYDVWVIGRVKLDFSAGLVLTGLADQTKAVIDTVISQTRTVDGASKVNDVVRQRTVDEGQDKMTLALATLGHLYWRTAWFRGGLNVGLSLGAGITTKGRPVYLAGGSLLLGRQQRVVLSGGVAVGTRKELSVRYDNTTNYFASAPAESLTYVDRTRAKWFAGLTFNFGQNEKKETIIGK